MVFVALVADDVTARATESKTVIIIDMVLFVLFAKFPPVYSHVSSAGQSVTGLRPRSWRARERSLRSDPLSEDEFEYILACNRC